MRKHARYVVDGEDWIFGNLGETESGMRIHTVSEGGAAFISMEARPEFCPPRKVGCWLQWEDEDLRGMAVWEAELLYVRTLPSQMFEYGIKFSKKLTGETEALFQELKQRANH